ncbi:MAG: UDP-N-acetylmuramate--L-alanine ligase [Candidatus Sungbacteria bacterium RIFCSPLOWO2_02_FULL_51_17]|uniref:UDP-N-acetylmuramate--L-alanine ligase n=1 Tax=Candidatus Sungbacteria bacterium RIFCSPHIGHO2_02_FULL_51_29 TaxID=1802273 RepID=A0A1G2KRZ4_9BACT|nr:MAG: UDP-N-acetylmuramate--L-alanine ligase [Candidatus Sungbacteria bacterium RIFCSPHIGHO2_01_FULL_51_22]OHA02196.1 MAG: UDP-N-acetylmuramate--L-alanine ligase [Candidatus Sungbacteria bacterium RIFCSPHIGHO2_02_FULL_51_29]OHA07645.1 MAG: UDP-N-acetylmuramate--L-alanine ligase [Candidatus Sungbacteria bacterium RIFCSPLOWO2_01_FULL_51_34]OHA10742.1 MAG: UDP-N-acetylmuramate--L-alanine ligase [Candidatus Sungbacteria bacterium RIFCSPLOWO2_02_FULL_51_17]
MKKTSVHFVGIGGIGMSSLARFYLSEGEAISGSDLSPSDITHELERLGVVISYGAHQAEHVPADAGTIIYTAATKSDNPERIEAEKRGLMVWPYARALGELTGRFYTIAVAGAHGKSTTTGMIALIMIEAGLDPTVIIGTKLSQFGNANFRRGESRYLLIEADEYQGSFLNYAPDIAVVTNIDREHMDYYKDSKDIAMAFAAFLKNTKEGGYLVLNNDNSELLAVGMERMKDEKQRGRVYWYSLTNSKVDDIKNILQVLGVHNVYNALAAYKTGEILGIPKETILKALGEYGGAWRRFDLRGMFQGAKVYDDYAHHPTEIKATLQGARERFPHARIWCIFQPHQRERLKYLFDEFMNAFDAADIAVILDPYEVAGREKEAPEPSRQSADLVEGLKKRHDSVYYLADPSGIREFLAERVANDDIIIMMGAGDIWKLTEKLI